MAAKAGQVIIDFLLNTAKFETDIKKVSRSFKQVGKELTDTGRELTKGITVPLLAIGGIAAKMAIDFESSFAGVRKTVNASEKEFAALADGFRKMAREIPVNVNELNRIGEAAGQLGIETKNILGFTRVMADLGVTTNLSSDQAATALARLANITQMPQDQFDRLGSTIVALGNNFATTESEIVEMGLRLAGSGKQIGLSEHQILSFAAALSSVGIEAEAGGSALSKVFIEIASEVETSGKKLGLFAAVAGMSAKQFQKAFREDAAGAINAFITGLGRIDSSGGSTIQVLAGLGIEEVRMRDAMLRVSGAGDLVTKSLKTGADAWKENTALSKEAAQRYETFASKLTLFKNQLVDVAITLGDALLPILRDGLDVLKPMVQWLAGVAKAFSELPDPIKKTVIVLGGIAAAIGPVLFVFGSLATSIGKLIPIFVSTAGHIATFIRGMGGLSTALVGATGGITTFGTVAAGLGAFWMGWELGKLLDKIGWVNAAGNKMAEWITKIPGLAPNTGAALNSLEASTQRLADRLKSLGVNVDRLANESIENWATRVNKAAQAHNDLKPKIDQVDKASGAAKKTTDALAGAFDMSALSAKGAKDELKNLSDETEKALRPMDELADKIKKQIDLGFSKYKIVQLYSDQILNASQTQMELTGELDDGQRELAGIALAFKLAEERSKGMAEGFKIADDKGEDLNSVLSDMKAKVKEVNTQVEISTDLWGDFYNTIKTGEPGLRQLDDVWLPDIKDKMGDVGDETDKTREKTNELGNQVSTIFTNMAQDIANNILEWKGWAETLSSTVKSLAKAMLSHLIEGLFSPLNKLMTSLGNSIGNWFTGLFTGGGGGGGIFNTISSSFGSLLSKMGGALKSLLTNPWTAIGVGAGLGVYKLVDAIRGPNSWEAGSEEAMRDFKVSLSDDTFQKLVESWGYQENQIWDIRKDLLSAPQTLANVLYPLAQQQGKVDEFLKSLEAVQTAWGTFNFRPGFELGLETGDWSKLNEIYVDAFEHSESLAKVMTDWQNKLLITISNLNSQLSGSTASPEIPEFASGTNFVPADMLAYVHRGEKIIPAGDNGSRTVNVRGGDISLSFSISGGGDDLVQTIKNRVIPILRREMEGGNSGLRESIVRAYGNTARAY